MAARKQDSVASRKTRGLTAFLDRVIEKTEALENKLKTFFTKIGENTCGVMQFCADKALLGYGLLKQRYGKRVHREFRRSYRKGKRIFAYYGNICAAPFRRIASMCSTIAHGVTDSKGERFGARIRHFFTMCGYGIRHNADVIKTIVNHLLPVGGIALLVYVVNFAGSLTLAVNVSYNGENLGYVTDESVVNSAKEIVQNRMVYLDDSERVELSPTYSIEVIQNEDVLTEYQLADQMIQLSGDEMVEATGLYIDGVFYGAVENSEGIRQALDGLLAPYQAQPGVESVGFVNDVEMVRGIYLTENIVEEAGLIATITGETQAESYYTVEAGDTPIEVANRNGMRYADLKELNPGVEESFLPGQQLLMNRSEAFLPVEVTRTVVYNEAIDYETEITESAKYAKGTQKVTRQGEEGESRVTAKITYVDDAEVSRQILNSEVVKEPVSKQITKGTAVIPVNTAAKYILGDASNSGFINPLPGCYLSSAYGPRWGTFHGGVDLCIRGGTRGKPIYAAAGGTVVAASNAGAYGKLVKIDHGNGVQTWYAHTSSMVVSAGEVVSQGQLIAYAGATGNVTGPHLHLEVRVNGVRQNPLNYIPMK